MGNNKHKPVIQGTAFIVLYQDQFYLVTNFHIMTGLNPVTFEKIAADKGEHTSVVLFYRGDNKKQYGMWEYQLFDNKHNPKYETYPLEKGVEDVAIMSIVPPKDAQLMYFKLSDIETEKTCGEGENLSIIGFPAYTGEKFGVRKIVNTKTIYENSNWNHWLNFKDTNDFGMSGSPVYHVYPSGQNKLIGICTGSTKYNDNSSRTGYGIYMWYAIEAIKNSKKRKLRANLGAKFNL